METNTIIEILNKHLPDVIERAQLIKPYWTDYDAVQFLKTGKIELPDDVRILGEMAAEMTSSYKRYKYARVSGWAPIAYVEVGTEYWCRKRNAKGSVSQNNYSITYYAYMNRGRYYVESHEGKYEFTINELNKLLPPHYIIRFDSESKQFKIKNKLNGIEAVVYPRALLIRLFGLDEIMKCKPNKRQAMKISANTVHACRNAEVVHRYIEIVGEAHYIKVSRAQVIDQYIDKAGNKVILYRMPICGRIFNQLKVVCPSTGRVYFIFPPDQRTKNAGKAWKSTFDYKPIAYRHGDVGIVKDGLNILEPIHQS